MDGFHGKQQQVTRHLIKRKTEEKLIELIQNVRKKFLTLFGHQAIIPSNPGYHCCIKVVHIPCPKFFLTGGPLRYRRGAVHGVLDIQCRYVRVPEVRSCCFPVAARSLVWFVVWRKDLFHGALI